MNPIFTPRLASGHLGLATWEPLQLHRFRCNKNLPVHIFVFQTLALHIFVFQHHDPPEGFQDLKKEQMIRIDI